MAGRNWTRKSLEELIDDYLRKHGGGGEVVKNGYAILANTMRPAGAGQLYLVHTNLTGSYAHIPNINGWTISQYSTVNHVFAVPLNRAIGASILGVAKVNEYLSSMDFGNIYFTEAIWVPTGGDPIVTRFESEYSADMISNLRTVSDSVSGKTFYSYTHHFHQFEDETYEDLITKLASHPPYTGSQGTYILSDYRFSDEEIKAKFNASSIITLNID